MKNKIFSLLFAILLIAFPIISGCSSAEKDADDKKNDNPPVSKINWTVDQVTIGENMAGTTHLKVTFESEIVSLSKEEVNVANSAQIDPNATIFQDDTDAKIWYIPVVVTESGVASLFVNKSGVKGIQQAVEVTPSEVLPKLYANLLPFDESYTGTPYTSTTYPATMPQPYPDQPNGQKIPGIVMCAYYDVGDVGVAFNDSGSNTGGALRTGNPCVDVKFVNTGDDSAGPHLVPPIMGMPYVGWTNAGEWFKITVDIQETAVYDVALRYSSNNEGAKISLAFDPDDVYQITPTWTKGHHRWNKEVITTMSLKAGKSVLTFKVEEQGQMNLCYLEFTKVTENE